MAASPAQADGGCLCLARPGLAVAWPDPDLWYALAEIVENPRPHPALAELFGKEVSPELHTELFVHDFQPYGCFYLSSGPVLGGEPTGRCREFLATYLPGLEQPSLPDNLGFLLSLIGRATEKGAHSVAEAILHEQLAPWVPLYTAGVINYGGSAYRAWAESLHQAIEDAANSMPAITKLPLQLAFAPDAHELAERKALEEFALSPVLSGLLLPRSLILQIAGALETPSRFGGRKFSFSSLIDQAPRETVEKLVALLADQASWGQISGLGLVGKWWSARRRRAEQLLLGVLEQ